MFANDELKALSIFLDRVTLKGVESDTHAFLKKKIALEMQKLTTVETSMEESVLSPIQREDLNKTEPEIPA